MRKIIVEVEISLDGCIGVDDLEKSVVFYRALGFKTDGIAGKEFEYGWEVVYNPAFKVQD